MKIIKICLIITKKNEILKKVIWRITLLNPLHVLGEKATKEKLIKNLLILLKIKELSNKRKLYDTLNKWAKNALKRVKDDLLILFRKFLEISNNNARKKILSRRLI